MPQFRGFVPLLFLLGAAFLPGGRAAAQQAGATWKPSGRVRTEVQRDDNPFLLTPNQEARLNAPSAGDALSGRFTDMASVTDVIPVAVADLAIGGPGVSGRTLEVLAEAAYEVNTQNARRRHAELRFGIEQAFSKGGRVRLRADWRPSYFWKNYLSDAVDASGDGNITAGERVYRPGTSDELDLTLAVRRRLLKQGPSHRVGVSGELEAGYFTRSYDAPFAGRDRRGPGVGAGVALEVGPRWTIGLDYAFQSLQSDIVREVQILDETTFGVDFNGVNGANDTEARAFERLDRSRTEHNLQASAAAAVGGGVTLEVGYARRMRVFSSTQPYDVSDRGRRDTRNELMGGLTVRFASAARFILEATTARQTTNRSGDPGSTGDVADYTRHVVAAGLEYRF